MTPDRYHRQQLLPQLQAAGQARLLQAQVLLIGCGALGCNIAQQLVRSGVGHLRIVDRDLVDLTNLHRQVLFTEEDAREQAPKAIAAARALRQVNSAVTVEPVVADVHSGNIEAIATKDGFRPAVILDGTDNAGTRYLVNDYAVREGISWVYGACVGVEGRVMAVVPGKTPCLRCIYPEPPGAGELATCDTAGVLGASAAIVGAMQAAVAIRLIVTGEGPDGLLALDAWGMRFRTIRTADARREDCVCCGQKRFELLNRPAASDAATLCGRDAVQVRGLNGDGVDMEQLAARLQTAGRVKASEVMVRCELADGSGLTLSVFADGRTIVAGTSDVARARTVVARYVGG